MKHGGDLPPGVGLILCEGPEDRAFWNGLLKFRGWDRVDPKTGRGGGEGDRRPYTLGTPDRPDAAPRPYVEVLPVGGYGELEKALRTQLRKDAVKQVVREVLLNFDTDLSEQDVEKGLTGKTPATVRRNLDAKKLPCVLEPDDSIRLTTTGTRVALTPWTSEGETRPGVPEKQTLERLVCDAVATAHPRRAAAVHAWLDSRPDVDPEVEPHRHKSAALSYYAGWYTGGGSFAFYEGLWRDDPVAEELERLLTETGVWAAVGRLLGEDGR